MVYQVLGLGTDHTQDPQISIKNLITSNWSLTGDLAVAKIKFNTGWYDKTSQYQLHFRHDRAPIKKRKTIGSSPIFGYTDFCNIHVFANQQTDNYEPLELGSIYREIDRIVSVNIIALEGSQGFCNIEMWEPKRTLPREESQVSIWHGYGVVTMIYSKADR